jgi:hypothetical protein
MSDDPDSLNGKVPESWNCVDCGWNTAPGLPNKAEVQRKIREAKLAGTWDPEDDKNVIAMHVTAQSEIYHVRNVIWKETGMEEGGGCLCIGCLENRLGRRLTPSDFLSDHPFNERLPGTPRLLNRQKRG